MYPVLLGAAQIRAIERKPKRELVAFICRKYNQHGMSWAENMGPDRWSKAEVVAEVIRLHSQGITR